MHPPLYLRPPDNCIRHQVFNASNDEPSVHLSSAALLAQYYAGVPLRSQLGEFETLYSNRKAKQVLGWQPQHSWRKYVSVPTDGAADSHAPRHTEEFGGEKKRRAVEHASNGDTASETASKRARR